MKLNSVLVLVAWIVAPATAFFHAGIALSSGSGLFGFAWIHQLALARFGAHLSAPQTLSALLEAFLDLGAHEPKHA